MKTSEAKCKARVEFLPAVCQFRQESRRRRLAEGQGSYSGSGGYIPQCYASENINTLLILRSTACHGNTAGRYAAEKFINRIEMTV